jgi:hypothetical protein
MPTSLAQKAPAIFLTALIAILLMLSPVRAQQRAALNRTIRSQKTCLAEEASLNTNSGRAFVCSKFVSLLEAPSEIGESETVYCSQCPSVPIRQPWAHKLAQSATDLTYNLLGPLIADEFRLLNNASTQTIQLTYKTEFGSDPISSLPESGLLACGSLFANAFASLGIASNNETTQAIGEVSMALVDSTYFLAALAISILLMLLIGVKAIESLIASFIAATVPIIVGYVILRQKNSFIALPLALFALEAWFWSSLTWSATVTSLNMTFSSGLIPSSQMLLCLLVLCLSTMVLIRLAIARLIPRFNAVCKSSPDNYNSWAKGWNQCRRWYSMGRRF